MRFITFQYHSLLFTRSIPLPFQVAVVVVAEEEEEAVVEVAAFPMTGEAIEVIIINKLPNISL